MATTVGQYCIYVSDIERSERFYTDIIGLKVQSRTEIPDVHEIVLAADVGGGRLQLAERYSGGQPIDHGFALWKIYMNVDDCVAVHDRAVAAGYTSTMAPRKARPLAGDRRPSSSIPTATASSSSRPTRTTAPGQSDGDVGDARHRDPARVARRRGRVRTPRGHLVSARRRRRRAPGAWCASPAAPTRAATSTSRCPAMRAIASPAT